MLSGSYKGLDTPLVDPDVQSALDRAQQEQMMARFLAAKGYSSPTNVNEGLTVLGEGAMEGISSYLEGQRNKESQSALASALSGTGGGSMPSMPFSYTQPPSISPMSSAGTPLASLPAPDSGGTPLSRGLRKGTGIPDETTSALGPMKSYADAIAGNESRGIGGYDAVNPKSGATGRYQVMPANVGPWTEQALGRRMSVSEFKADHRAQDAVFADQWQRNLAKYGSPQEAASVWFTGQPQRIGGSRNDYATGGGMTGNQYVSKFMRNLGQTSDISPSSQPVPKGQVAGPAVPSDLNEGRSLSPSVSNIAASAVPKIVPPPISPPLGVSPPGFRDNRGAGTGGSMGPGQAVAAAPPPAPYAGNEPLAPAISPSQANPALSPEPMGPPGSFVPGGPVAPGFPPSPGATPPGPFPPISGPGGPPPSQPVAAPPQVGVPAPRPPMQGGAGAAPPGTHWAQLPGPPLLLADNQDLATAGRSPMAQQLAPRTMTDVPAPSPIARSLGPQAGPGAVSPNAGPAPAQMAQNAPQSNLPPEVAGLQQGYSQAQSAYGQLEGRAQQVERAATIAAISRNPAAGALQSQAAALRSQANQYQEQMKAYQNRAYQLQDQAEKRNAEIEKENRELVNKPQTAGANSYVKDPKTGEWTRIGGPDEEKKPVSVQEFEYAQKHPEFAKAPKWVPNAKINDLGQPEPGWVSPPNPAAPHEDAPTAGLTEQQQKEIGSPNTYTMPAVRGAQLQEPTLVLNDQQNAAMQAIPEARRGMVQAILQNDMILPKITQRAGLANLLNQDVRSVMPNFDAGRQAGQVKAKTEFLSGGPNSYSKQIEFGDTAINHLLDYTKLSDKVADYSQGDLAGLIGGPNAQALGVRQAGRTNEGNAAITTLNNKASTFSTELSKYLSGGESSKTEREDRAAAMAANLPPSTRKQVVLDMLDTIEGRKSEIQSAWHNAAGKDVADFPVISDHAQESLDKIRAWAAGDQAEAPAAAPAAAPATPSVAPAAGPSPAQPQGSTEPYVTRALRGGLPFVGPMVAGAQTVLPSSMGGKSGSYATNLAAERAGEQQFTKQHPMLSALGSAAPYAPVGGSAAIAAMPTIAKVLGRLSLPGAIVGGPEIMKQLKKLFE